eukprot:gb/GECG01015322.1/.p1 GENE.gb/GECG01015322.1/~~gb/GECG01015322.1/.p1  ORF type:complete len:1320 (+),score=133.68 gb/GECG01015322.1/:1-3960(+)
MLHRGGLRERDSTTSSSSHALIRSSSSCPPDVTGSLDIEQDISKKEERRTALYKCWNALKTMYRRTSRALQRGYSQIRDDIQDRIAGSSSSDDSGSEEGDKDAHGWRIVYLNRPEKTPELPNNAVRSTKYTLWTFIPHNLYDQFRSYMNRYFLFIACLQLWSAITPVNPITTWAPLIVVLVITAIRAAYDDYRRYKADEEVNSKPFEILQGGISTTVLQARDIRPGHLVIVKKNEQVPCDLVALKSRMTEQDDKGVCYVQTANLDGETDLKPRYALHFTNTLSNRQLTEMRCCIKCDPPNADVHKLNALLSLENNLEGELVSGGDVEMAAASGRRDSFPLDSGNLIQQGTTLKDTEYVVGVAVYTGRETKLGQNTSLPPTKMGSVDAQINYHTAGLFVIQIVLVSMFGVIAASQSDPWYITPESKEQGRPWYAFLIIPLRVLLLISMLIPISLRVTLDLAKSYYAYLITNDVHVYDEASDVRAMVNNSDIIEDLGCIDTIFTDKTGTLTDNVMNFKMGSVDGEVLDSQDVWSPVSVKGKPDASRLHNLELSSRTEIYWLTLAVCNSVQPVKRDALRSRDITNRDDICHSMPLAANEADVELPKAELGSLDLTQVYRCVEFQSASPDEEALVYAASRAGITLFERNRFDDESEELLIQFQASLPENLFSRLRSCDKDPATKRVWVKEEINSSRVRGTHQERLELLHVIPFTSQRKRMSVVIRCQTTSMIFVLCKGADEALFPRLRHCERESTEAKLRRQTNRQIEMFANRGLRTLMVVVRRMSGSEYAEWLTQWEGARRQVAGREKAIEQAAGQLECQFELVGASAVEDTLQQGVPETIENLRLGGCRFWMLTGDKYTTAIQIALASRLMDEPQETISLKNRSSSGSNSVMDGYGEMRSGCFCNLHMESPASDIESLLSERKRKFVLAIRGNSKRDVSAELKHINDNLCLKCKGKQMEYTLVIDGCALPFLLKYFSVQFKHLVQTGCKSVICCRASPSQKAELVQFVRRSKHSLIRGRTLAIGDGGNDCPMLLAANVGVGLVGREGMQASRSADFSISRFRFLERLMLVHGRLSLHRTSITALFCFYKSIVLCSAQVGYVPACLFSGCSLFDTFCLTTYNMIYTALPALLLVLDREWEISKLERHPHLYAQRFRFAIPFEEQGSALLATGYFQAGAMLLISTFASPDAAPDIPAFSYFNFTALLIVVFLTLLALSHRPVWINHVVNTLCLLAYPVLLWLRGVLIGDGIGLGTLVDLFSQRFHMYTLGLIVVVCVLPVWMYALIRRKRIEETERSLIQTSDPEVVSSIARREYKQYGRLER